MAIFHIPKKEKYFYSEEWYVENADKITDFTYYYDVILGFSMDFFNDFRDEINLNQYLIWLLQNNHFEEFKRIYDPVKLGFPKPDQVLYAHHGDTVFDWVCSEGTGELFFYLMQEYGGDMSDSTLKRYASYVASNPLDEDHNFFKELLEFGIDVNTQLGDGKDQTFLTYFCNTGELDMVKLLVEKYGADISIKDSHGCDALCFAKHKEQAEVVEYLENINKSE